MNGKSNAPRDLAERALARTIGAKAERKMKARQEPTAVWFGLRAMGVIGWSVAVPTLLGAALGIWLDEKRPGRHGFTLALMMAGLALGCANAWRWLARQNEPGPESGGPDD